MFQSTPNSKPKLAHSNLCQVSKQYYLFLSMIWYRESGYIIGKEIVLKLVISCSCEHILNRDHPEEILGIQE